MKTTILKFLAFLNPEWVRKFLHYYGGLAIGFYVVLHTGIIEFTSLGEKFVGAIMFSAAATLFISGLYETFQHFVMKAKFDWMDILASVILSSIGGLLAVVFPFEIVCDILVTSAITLLVFDLVRLLIIKFWK